MPLQKRSQGVQELVLCCHDGRMVSGQFQSLDKGTLRSENVVYGAVKRNRVLSRHDQNRPAIARLLKGLEEPVVGPPIPANAHHQAPVSPNRTPQADTGNESIDRQLAQPRALASGASHTSPACRACFGAHSWERPRRQEVQRVSSFALSPDVPAQIVQGLETDGPIPSGEKRFTSKV